MDKKRSQLQKTLKGVQKLQKKVKDMKKSKHEAPQFNLMQEMDNGLKLEVAEQFLDLESYGCRPQKQYAKLQETIENQQLFDECLRLIE